MVYHPMSLKLNQNRKWGNIEYYFQFQHLKYTKVSVDLYSEKTNFFVYYPISMKLGIKIARILEAKILVESQNVFFHRESKVNFNDVKNIICVHYFMYTASVRPSFCNPYQW